MIFKNSRVLIQEVDTFNLIYFRSAKQSISIGLQIMDCRAHFCFREEGVAFLRDSEFEKHALVRKF